LGGTDASKVCLVHLVHHLRRRGFALLDTQIWNQHLGRYGCIEIPAQKFKRDLARATERRAPWAPFEPEKTLAEL
jgi:leucyl/phenylalanyl-tRNA--protein transferase